MSAAIAAETIMVDSKMTLACDVGINHFIVPRTAKVVVSGIIAVSIM